MIRKANICDLKKILFVYSRAREFMKNTGNPDQWGDNYPPEELIKEDILLKRLYVFEKDNDILGAFVFFEGEEPVYSYIEGAWLDNMPYGVIHRVANGGKLKGTVSKILEFCQKTTDHIRIDTHKDNKVMQHVLEKNGFKKCGIIYLENGDSRIAYEKTSLV